MDQETITRAIISNLIDRYVDEIAADPNRRIRQLVDIGERICDGPRQKIFYQMMQEMARNQESPYYRMFQELATRVDVEKIRRFGIDLGYNSWTSGARNIRLLELETGIQIPWMLAFIRTKSPDRLPFSEVHRLIDESRELEIYSCMILYEGEVDEWQDLAEVFQKYEEMAFTLFIDPEALTDEILEDIDTIHNVMVILNTDSPDWQESASTLIRHRALFSCYRTIRNEKDVRELTSGEWAEELIPFYPLGALTIVSHDCSPEIVQTVSDYMRDIRLDQRYPFMPANMISDFTTIGEIISNRNLMIVVESSGDICYARDGILHPAGFNAKLMLLEDILDRAGNL